MLNNECDYNHDDDDDSGDYDEQAFVNNEESEDGHEAEESEDVVISDEDSEEFFDDEDDFVETERGIHQLFIEDNGTTYSLEVKITPHDFNNKRAVDIIGCYDVLNDNIIEYPRRVINPKKINQAIDLLIWSIKADPDLPDDKRLEYLSDLQGEPECES